jgi:phage regulator Rha-like protein
VRYVLQFLKKNLVKSKHDNIKRAIENNVCGFGCGLYEHLPFPYSKGGRLMSKEVGLLAA